MEVFLLSNHSTFEEVTVATHPKEPMKMGRGTTTTNNNLRWAAITIVLPVIWRFRVTQRDNMTLHTTKVEGVSINGNHNSLTGGRGEED